MTYFLKTAYWIPLLTNAESVDKTTNTYFKVHASNLLRKTKQGLLWSDIIFQNASVSLYLQKLTKISISLRVKYSNILDQVNNIQRRIHALKDV